MPGVLLAAVLVYVGAGGPAPDFDLNRLLELPAATDVLVVVNLGGWGRVPVAAARDLSPVLERIHWHLRIRGKQSAQVVFRRGDVGPQADLSIMAEMVGFHHAQARKLALDLCRLRCARPGLLIIMVGLSNGATFADQVMDQFAPGDDYRLCAIEIAPPFWRSTLDRPNVLRLDNDGTDPLPAGELGVLVGTAMAGLLRYGLERVRGRSPRFEEVFHVPGHDYSWPALETAVTRFLDRQLAAQP